MSNFNIPKLTKKAIRLWRKYGRTDPNYKKNFAFKKLYGFFLAYDFNNYWTEWIFYLRKFCLVFGYFIYIRSTRYEGTTARNYKLSTLIFQVSGQNIFISGMKALWKIDVISHSFNYYLLQERKLFEKALEERNKTLVQVPLSFIFIALTIKK